MNYWNNKESLTKKARTHTAEMSTCYAKEIANSVISSIIYGGDGKSINFLSSYPKVKSPEVIIEDLDTVSAARKYADNSTPCILNFASYKYPGGQFVNGSKAQEECLCHESFLFNVLKEFNDTYYAWNIAHKNKALYQDRAIWSPNITFFSNNQPFTCNVITCAAPNKTTAKIYMNVTDEENTECLNSRIKTVLSIAAENNEKILILGAWGCGVFGQDANEVAEIFKDYLTTLFNCFDTIVFAIPNNNPNDMMSNYAKFKNVFCL